MCSLLHMLAQPLQKQFKRHFTSLVPTAKIESVRFRSVAFAAPTAKLPSAEDDTGKGKSKGKQPAIDEKDKEGRQHDRDRATSWRAKKGGEEEEPDKKQYLTPKEKKRIAFIRHELHSGVDAVNAYVVFAHPIPDAGARPANVPPPAPTMDPYEAARLAAERCDGTVFMERTIRVDRVGKGGDGAQGPSVPVGDPKLTIFVGNLDFASKEEDLRAFFEALVVKERGAPGEASEESSEDEDEDSAEEGEAGEGKSSVPKPRTWVKRVRIVRDKDTQLGKGFAYVQFVVRPLPCLSHPGGEANAHLGPAMRRRDPRARGEPAQVRETQAPRAALQDRARLRQSHTQVRQTRPLHLHTRENSRAPAALDLDIPQRPRTEGQPRAGRADLAPAEGRAQAGEGGGPGARRAPDGEEAGEAARGEGGEVKTARGAGARAEAAGGEEGGGEAGGEEEGARQERECVGEDEYEEVGGVGNLACAEVARLVCLGWCTLFRGANGLHSSDTTEDTEGT